jgi:hypothetical protein
VPLAQTTEYVEPRIVDGKERWGNQTDSGQNRLSPSDNRAELRSKTYPGIAKAMADQWFPAGGRKIFNHGQLQMKFTTKQVSSACF